MTLRFAYHGHPLPDWQAYALPDHLVICDLADKSESPLGTLIVRRRCEKFVPVPPAKPRECAA